MYKRPIETIMADAEVMEEIQNTLGSRRRFPRAEMAKEGKKAIVSYVERFAPEAKMDADEDPLSEAIIVAFGRPALLVRNNTFDPPESNAWQERLEPHREAIDAVIPSVGRVELLNHMDFEWVGTAWVIDENVLVTNRHVALTFAQRRGRNFVFALNPFGQPIRARVDFREEYRVAEEFEANIAEILFVAERGAGIPDIAFLRIEPGHALPDPIPLAAEDPSEEEVIAAIGYPARDSRNGQQAMVRVFGDIYDVKRLAPGRVTNVEDPTTFLHDCSTLGGNSGSPLIRVESREVVGLHFAGRFQQANFGVKASVVKSTLTRLGPVRVPLPGVAAEPEEERRTAEDYADREGYREDFLSNRRTHYVPLPKLSESMEADAAKIPRLRGQSAYVLNYTHFSAVVNKRRKLPMFTAVNIDGDQSIALRRRRTPWRLDPRIPTDQQVGNELYRSNALDRGHLVRRLDPVWGSLDEARLADEDTFHYTNCAPQHARFNQRTWLDLEEYILDNADLRDLKISVFTGPVFSEHDRSYRDIQLPEQFWKVVAMITRNGQLHATAYLLGQTDLLTDFEFAFGQHRMFQVPVSRVEQLTGLDFGRLKRADPLEAVESLAIHMIDGPESLIL